jgi:hypothetical protein
MALELLAGFRPIVKDAGKKMKFQVRPVADLEKGLQEARRK